MPLYYINNGRTHFLKRAENFFKFLFGSDDHAAL